MAASPVRVLLIDDEESYFLLLRRLLSKVPNKEFVVDWVSRYDQGLATLLENRHDACLLDHRLGVRTGLELLQEAIARKVRTPIIILTGSDDPNVDLQATELGAADFLVKDHLDPVILERVIRYSCQQAASLQALQKSHERFRLLFERSLDPILISDDHGRFVDVNEAACRLVGVSREQMLDWNDLPLKAPPLHRRQKSGGVGELAFTKPNGERCFIEFSSARMGPDLNLTILRDVTQRRALEDEIQEISEREQRRLGQDLHDGLGQAMTGIAFLAKVLEQKLEAKNLPEADAAGNIVGLINDALTQTRRLSRGLCPAVLDSNDIAAALEQLAENVRSIFSVNCKLQCQPDLKINDNAVAVHLYRIAQEAATNAVKHGHAKNISLSLAARDSVLMLKVEDDGTGLPSTAPKGKGMGLRVMQHRARMIGGAIRMRQSKSGGVAVLCSVPWRKN
jgi:PAS domain S-box-containing protein